jgi:hypothetical protein
MCTLEICIRKTLILEFADRCYFHSSKFALPKYYLYFEIMKYLKLSCHGLNSHPSKSPCSVSKLEVSPTSLQLTIFKSLSRSLQLYIMGFSHRMI